MLIPRSILPIIIDKIKSSNKGIVIYGARQVGKTTLVNEIVKKLRLKTLVINGDQTNFIDTLSSRDLNKIKSLLEGYDLLFVDEAQRIPEIGIALKIIIDNIPSIKILVTGSSSLDLASKISEPLTGRIWTYHLYPISFLELSTKYNKTELDSFLEERLIYGGYPELFSIIGEFQKKEYLQILSDAYLYKDLIEFGDIKNSSKIRDLLKLLAFQIGSQVSLTELGNSLGMSKDTVAKYIDLLEKSNIIFRLKGLSRNLRKEVVKMDKIYFFDLGIRNILIDNLKQLKDRNDTGQLWENFLIIERMKMLAYTQNQASIYFWRTYTGAELDYIEERGGELSGFEFKYGKKIGKIPKSWSENYPNSKYSCINKDNYLDFILEK
ncbi:MAG: AAA ATPase [Candidatus Woesebacteria bacterium GW2011_GWB1_39_10]|uniref:AAA ATPase n=2 Tax=Candidatus Woeseibacteriota TaxID=1752722 RepID=A0A0G0LMH9_9BACT|nr:MAG: AAA ATPase [Candidatus Woesebacteria bacterium GW2011_GWB1_39_10]KKS91212.1 MAG: AAA ATPase [Candidatus Woesebacteria bacterium GW2011_GWA1_43_12]